MHDPLKQATKENSLLRIINVQKVESKIYSIYAFHPSLNSSISHPVALPNVLVAPVEPQYLI
jgi:hypothetical protein